jgi:T5SS/PEP-CTERM-associated repeat protein
MGTGDGGQNQLIVSNGGKLGTGESRIGDAWNSGNNLISVSGVNSTWNAKDLQIGAQSSGNQLTVSNEGTVRADNLAIGAMGGANGNSVSVDGANSFLRTYQTLSVGFSGATNNYLSILNLATVQANAVTVADSSRITIQDGLLTLSQNLTVDAGGELNGWGTVSGDVILDGTLTPGDATQTGIFQINGDLVLQNNAELVFDILSLNEYDQIRVSDTIDFNGQLVLRTGSSYTPQIGDQFQLLDWGGQNSGDFTTLSTPPLPNNLSWDTSHLSSDGTVEVVPEPTILSLIVISVLLGLSTRRLFLIRWH